MNKTGHINTGSITFTGDVNPYVTGLTWMNDPKKLDVEKIIYNDRTTIVYWSDKVVTKSTAAIGEIFDEEVGFAICLLKKLYGKKIYGKKLYKRMINNAFRIKK